MKQHKPGLPAAAMDNVPRVTLTLTDETIWLTRHDPAGRPAATYPVSSADVGRAFAGYTSSTGLLPPDTLFAGTRAGRTRIGVWLPPARREIRYAHGSRTDRLTIPLPGLVFVGEGAKYWVWAALQRPATPQDRLYSAPLPNVHQDGGICQGSAKFPLCAPGTISAAAALFFESDFNDDLSHSRARHSGSLLEFLRSLSARRQFPSGALIEAGDMQRAIEGAGGSDVYAWMPTEQPAHDAGDDEDDAGDDPAMFMGDGEELRQEGDFV